MYRIDFIKKLQRKKEKTAMEKRTGGQKILFAVFFVVFVFYSLTLIVPFVWVFINSFKDPYVYADIMSDALALPKPWMFSNWLDVPKYLEVKGQTYFTMLFNSLWLSIGRSLLYTLCKVMPAYCVAKYSCKFTKAYYGVALFTMILPIMGGSAAVYKLYWGSGLANSPLILLAATGGMGFEFVMIAGFFRSLDNGYSEAAMIDGAGHQRIFWTISLPLVIGPVSALYIITLIGFWNDYYFSLMYMPNYYTIASGLYVYKQLTAEKFMNVPLYYAGVILSILPVLILFIVFNDKIMNKVSVGGLKG